MSNTRYHFSETNERGGKQGDGQAQVRQLHFGRNHRTQGVSHALPWKPEVSLFQNYNCLA
jgi:hypothetical protein